MIANLCRYVYLMFSWLQTEGADPECLRQGQCHPAGHHPRGHPLHWQPPEQAGRQAGDWRPRAGPAAGQQSQGVTSRVLTINITSVLSRTTELDLQISCDIIILFYHSSVFICYFLALIKYVSIRSCLIASVKLMDHEFSLSNYFMLISPNSKQ